MGENLTLLDLFVRGLGAGAMAVLAISLQLSAVGRHVKVAAALTGLSVIGWLITESPTLWGAFDRNFLLLIPAYAVAGAFWLLVATGFEDRQIGWRTLWPAAAMLLSGLLCEPAEGPLADWLWGARNVASALLALHAGLLIARGWRDDLMEARRRLRALLLGAITVFALLNVVFAFAYRMDRDGPWLMMTAGGAAGGLVLTALILCSAVLFLQGRAGVFGPARRSAPSVDPRSDADDQLQLQRLQALMAAGGWRQEGLTVGQLAEDMQIPEHRLRRLINRRLGHRNFADFLNSHRIEAAKQRLADPAQARTTVATIAFDLGYGSLGPFNRAFRAATGSSPTAWRKAALGASPELKEAV